MTRLGVQRIAFTVIFPFLIGCGAEPPSSPGRAIVGRLPVKSEAENVSSADVSILFVGNSHTGMHDLPGLIGQMIRFRHPEQSIYSRVVSVGFLEDAAHEPRCKEEIESRPWKHLVLQAQKESRSGQFQYSQAEGIEIAKLGKARGARVTFFAEWGLKDVADHGQRIERIYQEMATAAGARVAPVGRAWVMALSARPDLPLYAPDGNHQTTTGAFLTACVLFGRLTDESPAVLASFPYPGVSDADRKFLADAAAAVFAPDVRGEDGG
jgi:hypothetical protein